MRNGEQNCDRGKKQLFFFIKTNNIAELKKVLQEFSQID